MASPATAPLKSGKGDSAATFNHWVQSIGIMVAAAWAIYAFVLKEMWLPKSAPTNISISVHLKMVGELSSKSPLVPIELHASAWNPSSRKMFILQNAWVVWGYKMQPGDFPSFAEQAAEKINAQREQLGERDAKWEPGIGEAAGSLFSDTLLNPNETLTRDLIFYVPRDKYDTIVAQVLVPSAEAESGVELRWRPAKDSGEIDFDLFVDDHGAMRLVKKDAKGNFNDERVKKLGYHLSTSSTEIALR